MVLKKHVTILFLSLYIPIMSAAKVEIQNDQSLSPAVVEQLVFDFMKIRHKKAGVIFTCGRPKDLVHLLKNIGKQTDLYVVVKDISKQDTTEVDFRKCLPYKTPVAAVLNLNCNDAQRIIRMASDLFLFNEIHSWMVLGNEVSEAVVQFSQINLSIDTSLVFVTPYRSGVWIAYDLWNPGFHDGGSLNVTLYGFINPGKGYQNVGMLNDNGNCRKELLFPESLIGNRLVHDNATIISLVDPKEIVKFNTEVNNLFACIGGESIDIENDGISTINQLKFTVNGRWIIFLYESWISRRSDLQGIRINTIVAIGNRRLDRTIEHYLTHNYEPRFNSMQRHGVKLFKFLMEMYNFRMKMIRTNIWGPAVSGRGVVSALLSGQAELSGVPVEYKRNRIGLIDYTHPTWKCDFAVIFRDPLGVPAVDGFLKPLSSGVWLCSLGCILLAVLFYGAASRMEAAYNKDVANQQYPWSFSLLAIFGIFCQQGLHVTPSFSSCRSIVVLMLLFSMMLLQFYSASIVGSLLMKPPRVINTLKDLLDSKLEVGIHNEPFFMELLMATTDSVIKEIRDSKIIPPGKHPNIMSLTDGMERVRKGGFAFQTNVIEATRIMDETFDDETTCQVVNIRMLPSPSVGHCARLGSPFRQHIAVGLRRMQERGIVLQEQRKWQSLRPSCDGISVAAVTGQQVLAAPALLLVAILLAIVTLLVETVLYNRQRMRPVHPFVI